jgi:hypothetical protein
MDDFVAGGVLTHGKNELDVKIAVIVAHASELHALSRGVTIHKVAAFRGKHVPVTATVLADHKAGPDGAMTKHPLIDGWSLQVVLNIAVVLDLLSTPPRHLKAGSQSFIL